MNLDSPEAKRWLATLNDLGVDPKKPSRPIGCAPHKPLLLLIVCQLIEEGRLEGGLLYRDGALAFQFASYWRIVADRRRTRPDLSLPFYHMKGDAIWFPLELNGSPAKQRADARIAQIDVSFLMCLHDADFRHEARRTLIAKYFEPTERAELYSLCGMEVPPEDIVAADATRYLPSDSDEKKRDQKFSVRVLSAYDFTCALTRYRMVAIDTTTILDACHIHQFKLGGNCHPTNGIALSKTAHWLFDRGFWSLDDDFRILVAIGKFDEAGEPSHLLKPRAGSPVLLPSNAQFHPDRSCLRWHRERHGFAA